MYTLSFRARSASRRGHFFVDVFTERFADRTDARRRAGLAHKNLVSVHTNAVHLRRPPGFLDHFDRLRRLGIRLALRRPEWRRRIVGEAHHQAFLRSRVPFEKCSIISITCASNRSALVYVLSIFEISDQDGPRGESGSQCTYCRFAISDEDGLTRRIE